MKIRIGGNMKQMKLGRVSVGRVGAGLELRFDMEARDGELMPVTMEIDEADKLQLRSMLEMIIEKSETEDDVANRIVAAFVLALNIEDGVFRQTLNEIIDSRTQVFRERLTNFIISELNVLATRNVISSDVVNDFADKIRKVTLEETLEEDDERCCSGR